MPLDARALAPALTYLARELGSPELAALAAIARSPSGEANLRHLRISDRCGKSTRTVSRRLARFEAAVPSFRMERGNGLQNTRGRILGRRLRGVARTQREKLELFSQRCGNATEAPRAPRGNVLTWPCPSCGVPSIGDGRAGCAACGQPGPIHRPGGDTKDGAPLEGPSDPLRGPSVPEGVEGDGGSASSSKRGPAKAGPGGMGAARRLGAGEGRARGRRPRRRGPIRSPAARPWARGLRATGLHWAVHRDREHVAEAWALARRFAEQYQREGEDGPGADPAAWAPVLLTLAGRLGGWDTAMRVVRAARNSAPKAGGWVGWDRLLARSPRYALRESFIRAGLVGMRVPRGLRFEDGPAWEPSSPELGGAFERWQLGTGPEPCPRLDGVTVWLDGGELAVMDRQDRRFGRPTPQRRKA